MLYTSLDAIPSDHSHCENEWTTTGSSYTFNTSRPRQNGCRFPDNIFKCIFINENVSISIKISLKFVPNGLIESSSTLVYIMAWRRPGDKPLSEPMMVSLLTHICVPRPQWVNIWMRILCHNTNPDNLVIFIPTNSDYERWERHKCLLGNITSWCTFSIVKTHFQDVVWLQCNIFCLSRGWRVWFIHQFFIAMK